MMKLPRILLDPPENIEEAHIKYLSSIIKSWANDAVYGFTARFAFDLNGTNHWDGVLFVIEMSTDRCVLRRADKADGTDLKIPKRGAPRDIEPLRTLQVELDDLTPEVLLNSIRLVIVAEMMGQ